MYFMLRKYIQKFIDCISDIQNFFRIFLRDLQQIYDQSSLVNTCSISSAIAACFIKRVSYNDGYILVEDKSIIFLCS